MRNLLIVGGLCALAIAIGALLYFSSSSSRLPSTPSEPAAASAETQTPEAKNIAFKVLDHGTNAEAVTARKNYAIYDASEFATFWQKAHGAGGTKPPVVDFTKDYVIAVFAGTEPSNGYAIRVEKVTDIGTQRSVSVVIEEPGDSCPLIEESTSPYQFILVPFGASDALAHTDTVAKKDCGS